VRQFFCFSFLCRALASALLALAFTATAAAATEKIIHNFEALPHGTNPQSALIADAEGSLYGVTAQGGLHGDGVVYELMRDRNGKWSQKVLHDFAGINVGISDGRSPQGRLVFDSAGNLYGTTLYGGDPNCPYGFGCGTVFKLTRLPGGRWAETIIHVFPFYTHSDGQYPFAGLTFDKKGNLYGTTGGGGAYGIGAVFKLVPFSGGSWTEQTLYSFTIDGAGGIYPESEVVLDASGNIYSTTTKAGDLTCGTTYGRRYGCGTIFELVPNSTGGWTETILYTFTGSQNYLGPTGRLLIDSSGTLYGSAEGVIYELQPTSQGQWTYTALTSTLPTVSGDLALDSVGNLYGEGPLGNGNVCFSSFCGSVFELQHTASGWTSTVLYAFRSTGDGGFPWGGVTLDAGGNIFGVTLHFGDQHDDGSVFELSQSPTGAWQESVLYKFPQVDGDAPTGNLVADDVGNLYGVAGDGGPNTSCNYAISCGVVFRLTPMENGRWEYKIIANFSGPDGAGPEAGLVFDSSGNLYGTTAFGGRSGYGTVYKLSPDSAGTWRKTTLYAFGDQPEDGVSPRGGVAFDAMGNLYGTTLGGGSGGSIGSVFELSPNPDGTWRETKINVFGRSGDGSQPVSGLVIDNAGNLYGTTYSGGMAGCSYGCGVVFKMSPNGNGTWTESVIHSFTGSDGGNPAAALLIDGNGNLYGTASRGGNNDAGVVFELKPTGSGVWTESVLYAFKGGSSDGANPAASLTFDSAGNLYGTTPGPWRSNSLAGGTVFKLIPSAGGNWSESIVHFFGVKLSDGIEPTGGVLLDAQGRLFGTTWGGPGDNWGGTVFEITP
jgi:uncharacterized repeat protein (TIGR03803 family)